LLGLEDDAHAPFADLLVQLVLRQQILELDVAWLLDEQEFDLAHADAVTEEQQTLVDLLAIELGAVARPEIDQREEPAVATDLAVGARGVIVDDLHVAGRLTAQDHQVLGERIFATSSGTGLSDQFCHRKLQP
jgi:hypothetical protein